MPRMMMMMMIGDWRKGEDDWRLTDADFLGQHATNAKIVDLVAGKTAGMRHRREDCRL